MWTVHGKFDAPRCQTHRGPMDVKAVIMAVCAGAALPIQVSINTNLARHGNGAIWAAMISFGVGTLGLAAVVASQQALIPDRAAIAAAPWWAWIGGLIGAFYVAASIWVSPRIGAALLFALVVAGQMTMSTTIDHFGAIGMPVEPFAWTKAAGIALIVAGVVLVQR